MKCIDSSVIFPSNHVTNRSGQQATVRFGASGSTNSPESLGDSFRKIVTQEIARTPYYGHAPVQPPPLKQGFFRRLASSIKSEMEAAFALLYLFGSGLVLHLKERFKF